METHFSNKGRLSKGRLSPYFLEVKNMNREDFIKGLTTEKNILDENVFNIIKRSIASNLTDGNPRGHRNLIIVNEELAELA